MYLHQGGWSWSKSSIHHQMAKQSCKMALNLYQGIYGVLGRCLLCIKDHSYIHVQNTEKYTVNATHRLAGISIFNC